MGHPPHRADSDSHVAVYPNIPPAVRHSEFHAPEHLSHRRDRRDKALKVNSVAPQEVGPPSHASTQLEGTKAAHRSDTEFKQNFLSPGPVLSPPTRLTEPNQRMNWASLVQPKPPTQFKLTYMKPLDHSQRHIIRVPKEIVAQGSRKWEHTLVGHFIGKRLPYSLVKNATTRMWNKMGLEDMLATDSGYFFFKFISKEVSDSVLEGGPWHIAGQPILLRKWEPGLELSKAAPSSVPLWVHIHDIPLEYWNEEGLSYIASAIGKPIHVDRLTAAGRRISYARICVEVNAQNELLKSLEIGSDDTTHGEPEKVTLRVEYPWNPVRCAKCQRFGHDCNRVPKPAANTTQVQQSNRSNESHGHWMTQGKGKNVMLATADFPSSSNGNIGQRGMAPRPITNSQMQTAQETTGLEGGKGNNSHKVQIRPEIDPDSSTHIVVSDGVSDLVIQSSKALPLDQNTFSALEEEVAGDPIGDDMVLTCPTDSQMSLPVSMPNIDDVAQKDFPTQSHIHSSVEGDKCGGITTAHLKVTGRVGKTIITKHLVTQEDSASDSDLILENSTPTVKTGKAKKSKKGSSSGTKSH